MDHYYSSNPTSMSEERILKYNIKDKCLEFISDNGVFSKGRIDFATDFLLNVLSKEEIGGSVLDVGCGYGVIGITLSKLFDISVTMLDINNRALGLAKRNAIRNGVQNIEVVESDGFEKIQENFDVIVTNPPIRAGKAVIYEMYREAKKHLKAGGRFYLVINKKHGAPSTIKYLEEIFENVEILDKKAGFNVIKCK